MASANTRETPRPSVRIENDDDGLFDTAVITFATFRLVVRENTITPGDAVIEIEWNGIGREIDISADDPHALTTRGTAFTPRSA